MDSEDFLNKDNLDKNTIKLEDLEATKSSILGNPYDENLGENEYSNTSASNGKTGYFDKIFNSKGGEKGGKGEKRQGDESIEAYVKRLDKKQENKPQSLRKKGQDLREQAKYTEATECFNNAYQKFKEEGNELGKASIILDIAFICMHQNPDKLKVNENLKLILKDYYGEKEDWKELMEGDLSHFSQKECFFYLFKDVAETCKKIAETQPNNKTQAFVELTWAEFGAIWSNFEEVDKTFLNTEVYNCLKQEEDKIKDPDVGDAIKRASNEILKNKTKFSLSINRKEEFSKKLEKEDVQGCHFCLKEHFAELKSMPNFVQKYAEYVSLMVNAKEELRDHFWEEFNKEIHPKVKEANSTGQSIEMINKALDVFSDSDNLRDLKYTIKAIINKISTD